MFKVLLLCINIHIPPFSSTLSSALLPSCLHSRVHLLSTLPFLSFPSTTSTFPILHFPICRSTLPLLVFSAHSIPLSLPLVRHSRPPQRRKINLLPSINSLRSRQPSKLPLRHNRPGRSPCRRPRRSIHLPLRPLQTTFQNPCISDSL